MPYSSPDRSSDDLNDAASLDSTHLDNVVIFPDGSVFWAAAELPDPVCAAERVDRPGDQSLAALLARITVAGRLELWQVPRRGLIHLGLEILFCPKTWSRR